MADYNYEPTGDEEVWQELFTADGVAYYYNVETEETVWDKPDALMAGDEKTAGDWVWLPHEEDVFTPARVLGPGSCETEDGQVHNAKTSRLAPLKWSSLSRVTPDLVLLDSMEVPLILHALRKRYDDKKIYTAIGTICISINPYERLPIYGPEAINKYRRRLEIGKDVEPHVYVVGNTSYDGITFNENQSVVISGESGAGKTEAAKQVLAYLAGVAGSVSGIEHKMLSCNPILEGFGNAKTVRNNNSSRFGKFLKVFLNKQRQLCGGATETYLLEKIRVVQQGPNERNFHVFYELCGSNEARRKYSLQSADTYHYLNQSGCMFVDGIDDARDFADMQAAFDELLFSPQEKDSILGLMAGILHLGNCSFQDSGERRCRSTDSGAVNQAAKLFGVQPKVLEQALISRKLKMGRETVTSTNSAEESVATRDVLAKFVYGANFDFIRDKINKSMDVAGSSSLLFIGILDIFGFEIFEHNSFEQLCINFTNEKLQQQFCETTFKAEEKLYHSEGIQFAHIDFVDNQVILDIIEKKPAGVLRILDEELKVPKGSDMGFLSKVGGCHETSQIIRCQFSAGRECFVLNHYAGQVKYDVHGFLEKNRDTMSQDLLDLLFTSTNKYINILFPKVTVSSAQRKRSLGFQFSSQLNSLMKTLRSTKPSYIRCVKPNEAKQPGMFVARNCFEQLTYAGVFEAVQIRKQGFPFRLKHDKFIDRYSILVPGFSGRGTAGCKAIAQKLKLNMENVKMGRTMVLYRSDEHRMLELKRSIIVEKAEMEETLKQLCNRDTSNLADPEPYFQELSHAVNRAMVFKLTTPWAQKAKDILFNFLESLMDDETRQLLEEAYAAVNQEMLEYACEVADSKGFMTELVKECKLLRDRVQRINEEATKATVTLDRTPMEYILAAADAIGMTTEGLEYFRTLLNMTTDRFLQEQMRAAVRVKDLSRQVSIGIQLKDGIFAKMSENFQFHKFDKLERPDYWASLKRISFKKAEMAENMLKFQPKKIHSALTEGFEDKKELNKQAIAVFEEITYFMGNNPDPKNRSSNDIALHILNEGMRVPQLRTEIYCQVIKQMTKNPDQQAARKGWDLMMLLLFTFPPNHDFENYFEYYCRSRAPPEQQETLIRMLHTVQYKQGGQLSVPSASEVSNIVAGHYVQRKRGFTLEVVPPDQASYADLLVDYRDESVAEEYEVGFVSKKAQAASKAANLRGGGGRGWALEDKKFDHLPTLERKATISQAPAAAPAPVEAAPAASGPWEAFLDDESQEYYYYNNETGITTWDKPADFVG